MENVILTLNFDSYFIANPNQLLSNALSGQQCVSYLSQMLLHDLWSIVNRQNNIRNSGSCQRFNLVQDHGLVAELDQWLGESEGLLIYQSCKLIGDMHSICD